MQDPLITLVGNIVNDVELKHAETGPWLRLRLAVNKRRLDRENDVWVDGKTSFHTVVCWRELAENSFHSLRKGQTILVWGRLETNEYTASDGETRREETRIIASDIGHTLRWGTSRFEKAQRSESSPTVPPQTVSGVGAVDVTTGEITELEPAGAAAAS